MPNPKSCHIGRQQFQQGSLEAGCARVFHKQTLFAGALAMVFHVPIHRQAGLQHFLHGCHAGAVVAGEPLDDVAAELRHDAVTLCIPVFKRCNVQAPIDGMDAFAALSAALRCGPFA